VTTLRQGLYGAALLAALALLLWGQQQRIGAADGRAALSAEQARHSQLAAATAQANAARLQGLLADERQAQADLRHLHNQLRAGLVARNQQIEELKRENQELRRWADQLLPAAARRLRQRPALSGAAAYRDWLSGRGAVPAAGDPPP
jgi:LysB family phage lysis regulatory protein